MSLVLHCGAQHVTREQIQALPQPQALGPKHAPIHHADFIREVEGELVEAGYNLTEQAFGMTPDGNRLFGTMAVEHPLYQGFEGGQFIVGLRGSNDNTFARELSAGTRVFVCDNLAFSGLVQMRTKQTTFIRGRLPRLIEDMIADLEVHFSRTVKQVDQYRLTQIPTSAADAAILEMGRQNIVNWSELGKVVKEWDEPSHEEHAEDGRSVWRLFNAATETMKLRNPEHPRLATLAPKTVKLHRICDELADLPVAA